MAEKRKDRNRKGRPRNLFPGESQMKDGRYRYQWTNLLGERKTVYSWRLVESDDTPPGKRNCPALRTLEKQIQTDLGDGIDTLKGQKTTLNDMFAIYMEGKVNLKASTRAHYWEQYSRCVSKTLGLYPLSKIKYSDVRKLYIQLLGHLSISTVRQLHGGVIAPVFELARRDGYIRTNPSEGALSDLTGEKKERIALTKAQQDVLVDFLNESPRYARWRSLVTAFLGTGGRMGELLGLCWSDVDFKNELIYIDHELKYLKPLGSKKHIFYIDTPKTAAAVRSIPMFPEVKAALLFEKRRQMLEGACVDNIDGYEGFCFSNSNQHVYPDDNFNAALKNIVKGANAWEKKRATRERREAVEVPHISAHNLRHTFCTRLCETDMNVKAIQTVMGHEDISTTLNIYAACHTDTLITAFNEVQDKMHIG